MAPKTSPKAPAIKHFLDLDRFEPATLREMIEWGKDFKRGQAPGGEAQPFVGKALDAPVTRVIDELTRIQFGQILTSVRLMRYEGDLMMLHLLGQDITDTAVLRTDGDWANASTGASRGARRRRRKR